MIAYSKADSLTGIMYTHNYTRNQNAMPGSITCEITKFKIEMTTAIRNRGKTGNGIETEKLYLANELFSLGGIQNKVLRGLWSGFYFWKIFFPAVFLST